jgi:hypothetical protein
VGSLVLLSSSPFFFSSNLNSVPKCRRFLVSFAASRRAREMPTTTYTLHSKCQTSNHHLASHLLSTHLTNDQYTTVDSIISFEAKTTVLSKLR